MEEKLDTIINYLCRIELYLKCIESRTPRGSGGGHIMEWHCNTVTHSFPEQPTDGGK